MTGIPLPSILSVKKATDESVSNCRLLLEIMEGDVDAAIEVILRFQSQGVESFSTHIEQHYSKAPPLTKKCIMQAEKQLGYRLPEAYINVLMNSNGVCLPNNCFPVNEQNSWAQDHVYVESINGIGLYNGLGLEETNTAEYFQDWGYPDIGLVIGDTPASGHAVIMLDYRVCGVMGEPSVVFVDTARRHHKSNIIQLAPCFNDFMNGFVPNARYTE